MNVTDERLKIRITKAIELQEQGLFIIDRRQELPLPTHPTIEHIRTSRTSDMNGKFYDYETSWGYFSCCAEDYNFLILRQGSPPQELLPQPKLALATATMYAGYVSIHNNGSSFDLDLPTHDRLDYATLRWINQTLHVEALPVVVWQIAEADRDMPPLIRIANDSAMVFASSAIWSPQDQQLVAAQVVTTSQDLLKSIKATLANSNSKSYLTIKTPNDDAYLKGARKGFIATGNNLASANAEGTVTALLHPWSGDPQTQTGDVFYLVVASHESLEQKFIERLDLAIPWPLQPEWAGYLLEAGKREHLVEVLPMSGEDFSVGLRIVKNESLWHKVISTGLRQGLISIS